MKNRIDSIFSKPDSTSRALRILAYGPTKSGKSHLIFSATEVGPLFWQDTERGSDFYPPDHGHGFRVLFSKDPMKTIEAIAAANEMVKNGAKFRPIVAVDSASSIWFQQQEVAEELSDKMTKGRSKDRTVFRAWGPAKKPLKKLYEMLHTAQCDVIFTARGKPGYKVVNNEPIETGLKPDIERNLPFSVDLILEMGVRDTKGAPPKAKDFFAKVTGTRSPSIDGNEPPIHIGRIFYNPKFSDLLEAALEGNKPTEVEETVKAQADGMAGSPTTWNDLVKRLPDGWTEERAKQELAEVFGKGETSNMGLYWVYIQGIDKDAANKQNGSSGVAPIEDSEAGGGG